MSNENTSTLSKFRNGLENYIQTEFKIEIPQFVKKLNNLEFALLFNKHVKKYLIDENFLEAEDKLITLLKNNNYDDYAKLKPNDTHRKKIIRYLNAIDECIN